jgi:hypothetical protein
MAFPEDRVTSGAMIAVGALLSIGGDVEIVLWFKNGTWSEHHLLWLTGIPPDAN